MSLTNNPMFENDNKIRIHNVVSPQQQQKLAKPFAPFQVTSSPMEKRKSASSSFNISDVIVNSELSSRVDTSKWINQANIVTPDFKRSLYLTIPEIEMRENKLVRSCEA